MRYTKTDTLPILPYSEMRKGEWDVEATELGWKATDTDKARQAGLKVDDEGYLLK